MSENGADRPPHLFSPEEIQTVYRVIAARRDMRHFIGGKIEPEVLQRLFTAAHAAPSVGFMQPWRFIRISDHCLREQIYQLVQTEHQQTAKALGERDEEFLALKVEGVRDCAELLVVALKNHREQHIFGRRTLPEMDLASAACAIQNLWLAARAEGLGMGWVSLFDPEPMKQLLDMPEGSHPMAILCLGPVTAFYDEPMLLKEQWAERECLSGLIMENRWTKHD